MSSTNLRDCPQRPCCTGQNYDLPHQVGSSNAEHSSFGHKHSHHKGLMNVESDQNRKMNEEKVVNDESSSSGLLNSDETQHAPLNIIHRSASENRLVNESIQFLTALGVDPSTSAALSQPQYEIQILDDELSTEMDDEDENVVEIRAKRVPSGRPNVWLDSSKLDTVEMTRNKVVRAPPFRIRCPLPEHSQQSLFAANLDYKGIGGHGVQRIQRGIQRGNYSQLHRKAWLEVSDSKHRYGKNLRLYYRHWESLGHPTNNFFDWLDSTGDAQSTPLPNLRECPRSVLDTDTVLYITDDEISRGYTLQMKPSQHDCRGQILDIECNPVRTGPDGWIFVLRDNVLYGSLKVTAVCADSKQRFHHSSFFGGKAVTGAGIFVTDEEGFLTHLYPHSGHYRPGEADVQRVLCHLYSEGVDLTTLDIDMQQLMHVCRHEIKSGETIAKAGDAHGSLGKKTKMRTLYLQNAQEAALFLSHKARCFDEGLFSDLQSRQNNRQQQRSSEERRATSKLSPSTETKCTKQTNRYS